MRFGLRWTLLFALLPLLTLPWIGLRFVEQMSSMARDERMENMRVTSASVAAHLNERRELFVRVLPTPPLPAQAQVLPVELLSRVDLDQHGDEWIDVPRRVLPVKLVGTGTAEPTLKARVAVVRSQEQPDALFVLVDADDDRYVPALDEAGRTVAGDRVEIAAGASPEAMSRVDATIRMSERAGGWLAEIRVPGEPRLLSIRVIDVDYLGSRRDEAVADSGLLAPRITRVVDVPAAEARASQLERQRWAETVRGLQRIPGRKTVFDAWGQVLAGHGEISSNINPPNDWEGRLARWVLAAAVRMRPDEGGEVIDSGQQSEARSAAGERPVAAAAPALSALARALNGAPAQQTHRIAAASGVPAWLLTVAQPIWVDDRVVGALVLEQNTAARHAPGLRAIERLALLAAIAVATTVGALLLVASLTVGRIVRLRDQAESAIDARGRVVGAIRPSMIRDELGALAGSYQRVLERLRDHQDYLGNLRSRLVHELRTPIMVVRSSLENLAAENDPQRQASYLERVSAGAARLEKIVASMSEASSLESMLAGSGLEDADLAALLRACAEGYGSAFAPRTFVVRSSDAGAPAAVVPEAIVQALDKLVANAVDFASEGSVIELRLDHEPATSARGVRRPAMWRIAVRNQGPALPEVMNQSLFDSMVSVRSDSAKDRAHLGLGLYLVRLIAEFHGGETFANNVPGGVEIGFFVRAQADTHRSGNKARP